MWIGSVGLGVRTSDAPMSGTDDLVTVGVLRDGIEIVTLKLDYAAEQDLERGADRFYAYSNLPRRNHRTPGLPEGIAEYPSSYPMHGLEFSDGLRGHLKLVLKTDGMDMWIKDSVDLYVKELRHRVTSFDTMDWLKDDT